MVKVVIESVYKTFDNNVHAVIDANFSAEEKEFVLLVGSSGCGKTLKPEINEKVISLMF